jgi:hypothetical protein
MGLVFLGSWLNNIYSAAVFLVAAGVLGGLVGALAQRRVDRERLVTEWKQALRQRILAPKLDVARKLYASMVAGAVLTREEASELRLDESEVLLADLPAAVVDSIPSLIWRVGQYEVFRQSVRLLSHELLDNDAQLDGFFEREASRGGEYYEREVNVAWENSARGRRVKELKRNLPGLEKDAEERFAKLKMEFVTAHGIKADIQDRLINLMSTLKQITLRIS